MSKMRAEQRIDCHQATQIARQFYDHLLLDDPLSQEEDPTARLDLDVHAHYHQNHPFCFRAIAHAKEESMARVVASGKYADEDSVQRANWELETRWLEKQMREEFGDAVVEARQEASLSPEVAPLFLQGLGGLEAILGGIQKTTNDMNDSSCIDLYGELPPSRSSFE